MIDVQIISVEGIIFNDKVAQLVVPGVNGEIGIMKDHESFIAELKEGEIIVYDESGNKIKEFKVKKGTAEMHQNEKLSVLIDE